jgi:outer membrane immunogenic protein
MNVRLLTAAVVLAVAPLAAQADGMPSAPERIPAAGNCCDYVPIPDWSGVYFGAHVGATWSNTSWTFPFLEAFNTAAGQSFPVSWDTGVAGGHLGLNYQFNHFLIGAETSYTFGDLSGGVMGPIPGRPNDHFDVSGSGLFTLTGRLGFAYDKFLLYGKAGFASAGVEVNAQTVAGTIARTSQRENGWTAGGGLEMRLLSAVLFGVEYNYVDISGDRFSSLTVGTVPNLPFHADIQDVHTHAVVARLSILFGPNACCHDGILGKY